jgi:flagellar motor switch protein FliN/FliY
MAEDGELDADWGDSIEDDFSADAGPPAHSFEDLSGTSTPAAKETAPAIMGAAHDRSLDFILDIPLEVSVELGRTRMVINDLLQLGQGSVIELTKLAGEPLEILVNGKLVARGEVVVVNEKFGVRVTDIVSPMERVKSLG